jgi:predicted ATPase
MDQQSKQSLQKKFDDEVLEFDQMSYEISRAEQATNHNQKNLLVQPVPQMFQSDIDDIPLPLDEER